MLREGLSIACMLGGTFYGQIDFYMDGLWPFQEVETGPYSRSFRLPANIEWDKVIASFQAGMLNIQFPKRDDVKPCRILIQ